MLKKKMQIHNKNKKNNYKILIIDLYGKGF